MMVTGLTRMFRLQQEIISILEHKTFSIGDQCVTTTGRTVVIKMHEYLYYYAILMVYSAILFILIVYVCGYVIFSWGYVYLTLSSFKL